MSANFKVEMTLDDNNKDVSGKKAPTVASDFFLLYGLLVPGLPIGCRPSKSLSPNFREIYPTGCRLSTFLNPSFREIYPIRCRPTTSWSPNFREIYPIGCRPSTSWSPSLRENNSQITWKLNWLMQRTVFDFCGSTLYTYMEAGVV